MHSCISWLCIVVPYCLQIRHPYMSRMSYCARLPRSCSGVIFALWLRAPRSPVVHAGRDPCLLVLFSALWSDTCPIVVLVSNGLGHCSPRTRKNLVDSFIVIPRRNPVDYARTTERSAFINRAWLSHWYHHSAHFSSSSFSFDQAFRSVLPCNHRKKWQEPGIVVTA